MATKHRVTIALEDHECKELSALSDKHCVSFDWLGHRAIVRLTERHEKEGL